MTHMLPITPAMIGATETLLRDVLGSAVGPVASPLGLDIVALVPVVLVWTEVCVTSPLVLDGNISSEPISVVVDTEIVLAEAEGLVNIGERGFGSPGKLILMEGCMEAIEGGIKAYRE